MMSSVADLSKFLSILLCLVVWGCGVRSPLEGYTSPNCRYSYNAFIQNDVVHSLGLFVFVYLFALSLDSLFSRVDPGFLYLHLT